MFLGVRDAKGMMRRCTKGIGFDEKYLPDGNGICGAHGGTFR